MKVIDDKVSKVLQDKIEAYFLNHHFPWYYNDNSLGNKVLKKHKLKTKDSFDKFQFTHKFIDERKVNSSHINIIIELLNELNIEESSIIGCKANLKFKTSTKKKHNIFHVDHKDPHKVMIYYVNDSDGDTFFFKNGIENKVYKTVTPKKNRIVVFDGKILHASSYPITSPISMTLNFNFRYG